MRSQLSFEPTLLLDLRLEAGYTFAPFGARTLLGHYDIMILGHNDLFYMHNVSCACIVKF